MNRGAKGKIVLDKVANTQSGNKSGSLEAVMNWVDSKGATLLSDTRKITFYSHPKLESWTSTFLLRRCKPPNWATPMKARSAFGLLLGSKSRRPNMSPMAKARKPDRPSRNAPASSIKFGRSNDGSGSPWKTGKLG